MWDAIGAGGSLDKHMEHLKSEALGLNSIVFHRFSSDFMRFHGFEATVRKRFPLSQLSRVQAEDEFRQQAAKWAGSMSRACGKMGTQVGSRLLWWHSGRQITLPIFQSTIRHFEPLLSVSRRAFQGD